MDKQDGFNGMRKPAIFPVCVYRSFDDNALEFSIFLAPSIKNSNFMAYTRKLNSNHSLIVFYFLYFNDYTFYHKTYGVIKKYATVTLYKIVFQRCRMRLFIASPVILHKYASIKKDFSEIIEGKWVEEENLHLTWVFLGEIKEKNSIINQMQNIASLKNKIDIFGLEHFGDPPKIFFAESQEKPLFAKAKEFTDAGFNLYSFKPHITLCRIKAIHDESAYKKALKYYQDKILGSILPCISLYQSIPDKKCAHYRRIFDIKK